MATRLQKVLQAPVLLSLATLYPEGFSSKRVGDIPELAERLKNAVVKAGLELRWNDFKNEVERARQQLIKAGFFVGRNYESWEVTDCGVTRLREIVTRVLREQPAERLDSFWREDGPDGLKRWVVVFDRFPNEELGGILFDGVPKSEIYDTVCRGRGENTAKIWSAMFDALPNGETIDLLTSMYDDLLRLFLEFYWLRTYGAIESSLCQPGGVYCNLLP